MKPNAQFAVLLEDILACGEEITTRNSVTMRKCNLMATFKQTPLVTLRKTAWKNALREFEWFMSGSNDIKDLHPSVHHWWEPWANESGYIHNNYSKQFRRFDGAGFGPTMVPKSVDQIEYMINSLKNHPFSRRNVITTWHTHDMMSPVTPITNCHGTLIMAGVDLKDRVNLTMVQRSADMVLGLPHNWIQYWAFIHYLAHQSGRKVGEFTWFGHDNHIYQDHEMVAHEIIDAVHNGDHADVMPKLVYNPTSDDFKADDFTMENDVKPVVTTKIKMTV